MTGPAWECHDVFQRLNDYVDRELAPDEADQVTAHLEECARCAKAFAFEAALLEELKARVRRIRVPQSLKGKVEEALSRARREGS